MPLCNLTKKYYENIDNVAEFNLWKKNLYVNWKDIKISQKNNLNNITMDAGNNIDVRCEIQLPNGFIKCSKCNSIIHNKYFKKKTLGY